MLNTKYARLSGSKAYEKAFDVVYDIGQMFDKMLKAVDKAGGIESVYGTRRSAVENMIEIMICMATAPMDEIGHRARKDDCVPREMEEKLLKMMEYFDEEELGRLDGEGVTGKVRELVKESEGYCMFERLGEVVGMLEGVEGEEGEEEEEGEEDDEDEEEEELWGAKGVDVLRRLDEADARARRGRR